MSAEWKIIVRAESMNGLHEPFEDIWNDVIPDVVMAAILAGNFQIILRGFKACIGRPYIDFAKRQLIIFAETWDKVDP